MDYQGRLTTLRKRMEERGVDLVYLTRGANLFYLAGVRRHYDHGTDHNAYGDWASGAFIAREGGLILLAPQMGGGFWVAEGQEKPWIDAVRLIPEHASPAEEMRTVIAELSSTIRHVAVDEHTWGQTILAFNEFLPDVRLSLASDLITPMRMIKDTDEIAAMRRASEMADAVYTRSLPILKPGVTEFEVAREIDYQFQRAGAEGTSFETGVVFAHAGGATRQEAARATAQRQLQPGDSVTFDFGCVLDGYCSDFGRSAFVGEPSSEYRRVHDLVLTAQAEAIKAMKAGTITATELNAVARKVIADGGYDAGFTHRLGHGIGVTVHEPPFLDVVNQTVLQENMLFTIEPSVRVPGHFGNRVEDVVLVTPQGGVSLNHAPHALTVVD
ncbi:MAG: Xaa-Pro peptidase family protein [Chloroflexota bacterium]|nr:Xaa-Pro peptidase family protein [Chloroflexota bacterium]